MAGCMGRMWFQAPVSMILVQIFTTGMMVLSKIVISRGMLIFALLAYRNAIGALFVAPFAFFFDRDMKKKFGWRPLMWICINAFLGQTLAMGLYYYGLRDTTPSYATDFLNIIPVATFALSLLLRMESLRLGSKEGRAKVLGALLCVGGAMVISLYEGKVLHLWPSLAHPSSQISKEASRHNTERGTFFLVGSCLSYALWFIAQVKLLKSFPAKYWPTALTCLAGCIQSLILGVILDRRGSSWKLAWDLQLATVFYSGVLNTGATFLLVQWAISRRGPTYPSMFNSLSLLFTTLIESFFMGQDMTIGSVLGMCLIIAGLYGFLWGKRKDSKKEKVALHINTNVKDVILDSGSLQGSSAANPKETNKKISMKTIKGDFGEGEESTKEHEDKL